MESTNRDKLECVHCHATEKVMTVKRMKPHCFHCLACNGSRETYGDRMYTPCIDCIPKGEYTSALESGLIQPIPLFLQNVHPSPGCIRKEFSDLKFTFRRGAASGDKQMSHLTDIISDTYPLLDRNEIPNLLKKVKESVNVHTKEKAAKPDPKLQEESINKS